MFWGRLLTIAGLAISITGCNYPGKGLVSRFSKPEVDPTVATHFADAITSPSPTPTRPPLPSPTPSPTRIPSPSPTPTPTQSGSISQAGPQANGGYSALPNNPFGGLDYFIDSLSGNDTNTGRSTSTPFKTISTVDGNTGKVILKAGDRVFLKRGSTFRETLTLNRSGTAGSPITFSAYGTGEAPIITGADAVMGTWQLHSGNIYKTSVGGIGRELIVNKVMQTQARFPNAKAAVPYLYKDGNTPTHPNEASGVYAITDSDLPAPPGGTWAGASIVTRDAAWSYTPAKVTGWDSSTKKLTLNLAGYGTGMSLGGDWKQYKWGYFLFGALGLLDEVGEWYHDSASNTLYYWAQGGGNPSNLLIEFPKRDNAITIAYMVKFITFENIRFEGTKKAGIDLPYMGGEVLIKNCDFRNSFIGINGYKQTNTKMEYNTFNSLWEHAARIGMGEGLDFSYNVIRDIALVPGLVASQWTYTTLDIGADATANGSIHVHHNDLDRLGYSAIGVNGRGVVEYNIIRNPLLMLNDGGGITWDFIRYNELLVVRNNVILNCLGNGQSVAPDFHHTEQMCNAFYFGDHGTSNVTVESNTVKNISGSCVLVDSSMVPNGSGAIVPSMNQIIKNNKFFDCGKGVFLTDYSIYWSNFAIRDCQSRVSSPCFTPFINKQVTGNEIYQIKPSASGIYQQYVYSNGQGGVVDFGVSDNNKIFHPTNPQRAFVRHFDNGLAPTWQGKPSSEHQLTLDQWIQVMGKDSGSISASNVTNLAPAATRGRMIINDTLALKTFSISNGSLEACLYNLDGASVGTSITLAPFTSLIAEKRSGSTCN